MGPDLGPPPWRPTLALMVLVTLLLLPRLGERLYWGDEREDFNFIWPILEVGVPDMTGGFQRQPGDVNSRNVHILHSWGPLYEEALSVRVFGWHDRTAFRLWGVVFMVLSVPVVWRLARRFGQRGGVATTLYALSPFALVPARLSRYYGAVLLLSPLVVLDYWKTRDGSRWAPWRLGLWMALLYHHHTLAASALSVGLLVHWLVTGRPRWRGYAVAAAVAIGPILWWMFGLEALRAGARLQASLIPLQMAKTGWLVLASTFPVPLLVGLWRCRREQRDLIVFLICILLPLVLLVSAASHVTPNLRYLLPALALGYVAAGAWLESVSRPWAVGLFGLLAFTNLLQLVPLAVGNALPFAIEMGGRTVEDARRFVSVTARPRFLLAGHLSELMFRYEGPSETMQKLLRSSGYRDGDTITLLTSSDADSAWQLHVLGGATFDLNGGKPRQMLEHLFVGPDDARWAVAFSGEVDPPPGFIEVGRGDNTLGFWIDGPNPYNRRWRTRRGGEIVVWRRE